MTVKKASPGLSRRKGSTGEREVCHLLRDTLGIDARRNLTQVREGGADIIVGPYNIEVKRRKSIATYQWIEQAERSCAEGQKPVVAFRADGKKWMAVIPFEEWMRLAGGEL